jgi:hypothetical protein
MEERSEGESLSLLAAAGSGGVIAQLALGSGPLGVIAGGLAPVAVQASHRLAAAVHRRWAENAGQALEVAADLLDVGLDIFDERLDGHDERVELLARVIEGAARSTLQTKVVAFGRVLAEGLRDDGDVDEALLLASALAAIEVPHIAVLQHLSHHPGPPPDLVRAGVESTTGWRADWLAKALPKLAGVMDAVLAVLRGHGLIRDGRGEAWGDMDQDYWQIAPLGRRCLFLLDADAVG